MLFVSLSVSLNPKRITISEGSSTSLCASPTLARTLWSTSGEFPEASCGLGGLDRSARRITCGARSTAASNVSALPAVPAHSARTGETRLSGLSGALFLLTGADHADQDHHWTFIRVDNAADVWVSDVTAAHFAMSAVSLASGAKRATVQDCTSVE